MFKQYEPTVSGNGAKEEAEYIEATWTQKWRDAERSSPELLKGTGYFQAVRPWLAPGARLLEAGCGQGEWVELFASLGYPVTGVDISAATVARVKAIIPTLDLRVGDVRALAFPDGTFDAYLSFGVVEHFEDGPKQALQEAWRVLKPGGMALVSVPFFNREKENRYRKGDKADNRHEYPDSVPLRFFQYVMTEKELEQELSAAGFKVLKLELVSAEHTLKQRSPLVKRIAGSTKQRAGWIGWARPLFRRIWHLYVGLHSRKRYAHMVLGIARKPG